MYYIATFLLTSEIHDNNSQYFPYYFQYILFNYLLNILPDDFLQCNKNYLKGNTCYTFSNCFSFLERKKDHQTKTKLVVRFVASDFRFYLVRMEFISAGNFQLILKGDLVSYKVLWAELRNVYDRFTNLLL